ncbi:MAG: 2,3-diaminopropionate biosynthesis protein SbnA [Saprospiraceae bacterium]|nr:MAG: 2,3-diaminopropionate biosynthesis protein SbnA [Saprospiraceae bacterium]
MNTKFKMLEDVLKIRQLIGNTPLIQLVENQSYNLFAKLEYNNFSGSIKDRAANNILFQGINDGKINPETTIVESSSGNLGISMALHCNRLGLDFIVVVDPHISKINLKLLKLFATKVIMVDKPDDTGGYLLTRIETVKHIIETNENCFWTNQYQNENNFKGYRDMSHEINQNFTRLDYLFVATSSCGTITGLSKFVKQYFPGVTVVAVDIKGSLIFSDEKHKRLISGLGAGQKACFLEKASVDDVMILNHQEIITGCRAMLREHSIFAGGSSGACYYAARKYLDQLAPTYPIPNCLIICPDKGVPYIDNIYSEQWSDRVIKSELPAVVEDRQPVSEI